MKLSRETFKPFLSGNPQDVAKDEKFLKTLQNAAVCYGCTGEKLTAEALMAFLGKDKFFDLCVENNRFDILTNKNLEGEFLQTGKYLEEIYQSIKTQTPTWLQANFLSRFCDHGQFEFLKAKQEWAAIAKSKTEWEFLLSSEELSVFLLTDKTFARVEIGKASYLELNLQMMEKVYQLYGISPFISAAEIARNNGLSGVVGVLEDFLQEKGENIY